MKAIHFCSVFNHLTVSSECAMYTLVIESDLDGYMIYDINIWFISLLLISFSVSFLPFGPDGKSIWPKKRYHDFSGIFHHILFFYMFPDTPTKHLRSIWRNWFFFNITISIFYVATLFDSSCTESMIVSRSFFSIFNENFFNF